MQARCKTADGKTSAWSTAFPLLTNSDIIAPKPVTALSWTVSGTSFVGTWTKPILNSDNTDLKDFKDFKIALTAASQTVVYYVTQERFDLTFEANLAAFGSPQPTVQISVQARDLTGNLSTIVTTSASNPIPADLTGFTALGIIQAISLQWNADTTDKDVKNYEVYMSTSGSGFTPGPGNIVYTGLGDTFVFPTSNPIAHYFKARVVDVFNQGSVSYVSANAIPDLTTDLDLTAPPAPTGVTVSTAAVADGTAKISVSWSAVTPTILGGYVVRYSLDASTWQYINVPATQISATITSLLPATAYYVEVASMSFVNTLSSFTHAATYPITTAADTTAPSQPAAPSVSVNTLSAQVTHDMTKQGGGNLEVDVDYLEIHASVTTGFTPNSTTLQGTLSSAGQGVVVGGIFYFNITTSVANLYWKVIAVDKSKNKSASSNQTVGLPGLIQSANFADATITSAKIIDLNANQIVAGTGIINDLLVKSNLTIDTAGHIKSNNYSVPSQTGFTLDTSGLTIYDGTIAAKALQLQDSNNILPPAFADFEFLASYYHTTNVPNSTVWSCTSGLLVDISSTMKFNRQALRVFNAAITNPTTHDLILAPTGLSATGVNIDVSAGDYILSGWFKKNGSVNALIKLNLYTDTNVAITSAAQTVNSTTYTRFQTILTIPGGAAKVKAYITIGPDVANTGYDVLVDGLQLERKLTGATTASAFKPPSFTNIDGGQIVTGSIRSSAASPTVSSQPAWSINTAGNMQIGDALIRGSLIVGSSGDTVNLVPSALSNFEKLAEYYHSTSGEPNWSNIFAENDVGNATDVLLQILSSGAQFNNQCLRTRSLTTGSKFLALSSYGLNAFGNNITVVPGQTYIYSAYVKSNDITKTQSCTLDIYADATHFVSVSSTTTINSTSYTRIFGSWTVPGGITSCHLVLNMAGTSGSIIDQVIDGIQFELAAPAQTTPSTYVYPGVGNSYVKSNNYASGAAGWYINDQGNVEFNNGIFRGELEIISNFFGNSYSSNIRNSISQWVGNVPGVGTSILAGYEPTYILTGKSFVPNSAGAFVADSDVQAVFRMTPEGGIQIMVDPSHDGLIYGTDGNNEYDIVIGPVALDRYWGYTDFRSGKGYNRDIGSLLQANLVSTDNVFYAQNHVNSTTPSSMGATKQTSGILSRAWAGTKAKDFRPLAHTELYATSDVTMKTFNIIPIHWDIYDDTIANYNSASTRNRMTLNSVASNLLGGPIRVVKGIDATITSAGAGNPNIYLSTSTTTYNITLADSLGGEYCMGMYFSFPAGMVGNQFRYFMKLSNGTILNSTTKTISSSGISLSVLTNEFPMQGSDVFVVPNGISTVLVGVEFLGTYATNQTFRFACGQLARVKDSTGLLRSTYSPYVLYPRAALTDHYQANAYITLDASGLSNANTTTGPWGVNNSIITLSAQKIDFVGANSDFASVSLSPKGFKWGTTPEFRPQAGTFWEASGLTQTIVSGTGNRLIIPQAAPTATSVIDSNGNTMSLDFIEGGSNNDNVSGYRFICQRAGLYMVHFYANITSVAANIFWEIYNATTGTRYAIFQGANNSFSNSVSVLVPASAGDRLKCVIFNSTGGNVTLTEYRIGFAQII